MTFDRLAPHYDWMENVTAGERLQAARTVWLDHLRGRRRVLSAGEGHGRFAEALVSRFDDVELTVIEASRAMLGRAQQRLGPQADRVHWHCGDVCAWHPPGRFDAITTCFFLDCFPPETLAKIVRHLAACAHPDAVWLVVDFAVPTSGAARWRAQAVHWLMYAFFRRAVGLPARRLTPPDTLLGQQGFQLVARREFEWGLVRADIWRRRSDPRSA